MLFLSSLANLHLCIYFVKDVDYFEIEHKVCYIIFGWGCSSPLKDQPLRGNIALKEEKILGLYPPYPERWIHTNSQFMYSQACILERGITLVHPQSTNKSDKQDYIFFLVLIYKIQECNCNMLNLQLSITVLHNGCLI